MEIEKNAYTSESVKSMIPFTIDDLTPCLRDTQTGDIVETEIVRIKRKSFLSKFNEKTGWYVNWSKFPKEVEIYALVLKGTMDIQGMVAIERNMNGPTKQYELLRKTIFGKTAYKNIQASAAISLRLRGINRRNMGSMDLCLRKR